MNAPQTLPAASPKPVGPQKLKYSHEAMIDLILHDPTVTFKELGEVFDLTPRWVSAVVGSDAFQARLAERRDSLLAPAITAKLNERVQGVTIQALTIVSERLEAEQSAGYALDALGLCSSVIAKAAGGKHVR